MSIMDARQLIGRVCSVSWLDRRGQQVSAVSRVNGVSYVPMYGGFVLIDNTDVRLDRITTVYLVEEDGSRRAYFDAGPALQQAA
jgi:hypothetical protein